MPKRPSDAIDLIDIPSTEPLDSVANNLPQGPPTKKARKQKTSTVVSSSAAQVVESLAKPGSWRDIKLPGEDGGDGVSVYDDCADVRRKINQLLKTPNFKISTWLKDIGSINHNSYSRFMKEKGKTGGAGNGTYYAAYVYFEKVRIFEGKKVTPKRRSNEESMPAGFPLETPRGMWIMGR